MMSVKLYIILNFFAHLFNRSMVRNGKVEVEDKLAMMEVLSLCDTNGDDRLSLDEAKICEVCLGHTNTNKTKDWALVQEAALAINIKILS